MRLTGIIATAATGALAAAGAYAQQAPAPDQTPPAAADQTPPAAAAEADGPPSSEEVSSFAVAYLDVLRIQQQAQAELERTVPEERPAVEQTLQQQMASAVVEAGLTPERYNAIAQQSQGDPELQAQIQQELEAAVAN